MRLIETGRKGEEEHIYSPQGGPVGVEVQRRVDNAKGRSDLVTSAWVVGINP